MDMLLATVQQYIDHNRIDYETMVSVLVLFQADMLAAILLRIESAGGDVPAFLEQYAGDVTRMCSVALQRAHDKGITLPWPPHTG
jgi:hypothetical protein